MQFTKYLLLVFVFFLQTLWVIPITYAKWKANPLLKSNETATLEPSVQENELYSISAALTNKTLQYSSGVKVEVHFSSEHVVEKKLYYGDPDFYFVCKPPQKILLRNLQSRGEPIPIEITLSKIDAANRNLNRIEVEPNDTPASAQPIQLDGQIYCFADEVDYYKNEEKHTNGPDYFRFTVTEPNPKLCYIELNLFAQNVAPYIEIYRLANSDLNQPQLEKYTKGRQPVSNSQGNQPANNIFQVNWKGYYYELQPGEFKLDSIIYLEYSVSIHHWVRMGQAGNHCD